MKQRTIVMHGAPSPGTIRSVVFRAAYIMAGALLGLHCSPARFPVLHPVPAISRAEMAQGKAVEYFIQARDLERRGLHREAERFYELASQLDPSSRVLRDQLARKYIESGKFMQALVLTKGDRTLKELDVEELRVVAGIYIKTGDFMRAIEAIESISDPSDKDYYSLAIMYESIGNANKALLYYLLFYDENSSSFELGLKIVRLLVNAGRYAAADTLLAALEDTHGQRPALFEIKGTMALERHDTAGALMLFKAAIGIDSSYDEAIRSAAQVYLQKSDYPQAILCYEMLYRNSVLFKNVYGRTLAIL
ncbi:MAG: hypothetical protein JXA71_14885, partial [Chitinispirillaceae bacterium]|nr:hypothetical protein [Chitinispirillaceae bacterium]